MKLKFELSSSVEPEFEYPTDEEIARAKWGAQHVRCPECGQFLKKRRLPQTPLFGLFRSDSFPWVSHFYQDYWGEVEHK